MCLFAYTNSLFIHVSNNRLSCVALKSSRTSPIDTWYVVKQVSQYYVRGGKRLQQSWNSACLDNHFFSTASWKRGTVYLAPCCQAAGEGRPKKLAVLPACGEDDFDC